ncbi:Spore coat protein CotH [Evansella caseinilytica]|uniref:Spore coat protein CotH n=1 Tax=Evansella caseinilytica TaxID=1503961 RepID=A0A1H3IIF9_9BACI|nr:CotH kinase family protein [Evansella caseinilytica]SDY27471.1 Spore coat protein CotH [Evansella caseinilytica]
MIRNRYLWGTFCLLLVLFTASILVLPRIGLEKSDVTHSYIDKVFDQAQVATVDIQMNEEDLNDLLENPLKEEYYVATVVVNGTKVENAGIRTKGNSSLRSVASDDTTNRYSFKIDFDQYADDQSLFGLKKLNLNNNFSDSTLMREYLSYSLMAYLEVPTPAYSYMYVTINGEDWGLYLGVEQIDEVFLNRHFADDTGDLYKPDGVGSDLQWISENIEDYSGLDLKTNKDSTDQSAMLDLLYAINNGEDIEEYIDVDEMIRYFAVNTALVNLDSYQGQMKHNYYLYEENGVFSIIPWDYNMAFGGFGVGGFGGGGRNMPGENTDNQGAGEQENAAGNEDGAGGGGPGSGNEEGAGDNRPGAGNEEGTIAPNADDENGKDVGQNGRNDMAMGMPESTELINESSINFSITTPVSGTTLEDRPLLNALLSVDEYREQYEKYLEEIATSFFTQENIESITMGISSLVLDYVEKDPTKFYTTEAFLEGVSGDNSLPEFAVQRAESILAQLSGELIVEAETADGMFGEGGMPEMVGEPGEGIPDGMMPPGFEDGEMPEDMMLPDGEGGEMPFDQRGQEEQREAADEQQQAESSYSAQFIETSIFVALLIAALLFVMRFKRRV